MLNNPLARAVLPPVRGDGCSPHFFYRSQNTETICSDAHTIQSGMPLTSRFFFIDLSCSRLPLLFTQSHTHTHCSLSRVSCFDTSIYQGDHYCCDSLLYYLHSSPIAPFCGAP
ncbi:unnamed protein product [Calicophoron daubneyi]|uniref:Uncharacterized protein n=1 Tax=Calicophoron daubneyi TaxID=300641 RepID=A0AAV2TW13_CALDB